MTGLQIFLFGIKIPISSADNLKLINREGFNLIVKEHN